MTHSSTLAWKIPWTEELGRLQSIRSWRVGHDWATSLSLFTFMHWRRKWQPIPVFLPGESQGWGSLVGCHLWGCTWPPDAKNWLIGKDPDVGKDWRQEEMEMTDDEMVGWHHLLQWTGVWANSKVGDGQGGQACCSPWGCKESDTTEWLNNNDCANTSLPWCHDSSEGLRRYWGRCLEIRNPYFPEPRDALEITHPPQRVPLKYRLDIFWSWVTFVQRSDKNSWRVIIPRITLNEGETGVGRYILQLPGLWRSSSAWVPVSSSEGSWRGGAPWIRAANCCSFTLYGLPSLPCASSPIPHSCFQVPARK